MEAFGSVTSLQLQGMKLLEMAIVFLPEIEKQWKLLCQFPFLYASGHMEFCVVI